MRSVKNLLLVIVITCISSITLNVSALTIKDYRNDLAKMQAKKLENDQNKAANQQKTNEAKAKLEQIQKDVTAAMQEMSDKEEEIKKLEVEIDAKEEQIKDLVSFLQISNSENFYLKYVFGAENFTDLIYRVSVIEQLTTKNDQLIDEMNNLIEENKQKIKQLENKKKELEELNKQTENQIAKLGSQLNQYSDLSVGIDQEIKTVQLLIDFYVKEGCKEDQDLNTCNTSVPSDTDFIKPLKTGYVSENYGWRCNPYKSFSNYSTCDGNGKTHWHKGMDLAGNAEGTAILAAASGRVSHVDWNKNSCGGRIVTINHIINGKYYTTRYWHMLNISVKVGDIVLKGQKIGTVGGGASTWWDDCSTGAHLHFEILNGHYYGIGLNSYTYYNYYGNDGRIMDPRKLVSFPTINPIRGYSPWW